MEFNEEKLCELIKSWVHSELNCPIVYDKETQDGRFSVPKAKTYASFGILNIIPLEMDSEIYRDEKEISTGKRKINITMSIFGNTKDALNLEFSLMSRQIREKFRRNGFVIWSKEPIQRIPAILGTQFIERSLFEFSLMCKIEKARKVDVFERVDNLDANYSE